MIIGVAMLCLVLASAVTGCGSSGAGGSKAAPALTGTTLTGVKWDLADQRGHWVVVAFQSAACVPCRKEIPEMRDFATAHPAVRLVSVGVAETDTDFGRFLAPFHLTWPAITDREGYISDRWNVDSLPVTVVVDPQGRVRRRFGTEVNEAALTSAVG
jgi:peroxiredoxin